MRSFLRNAALAAVLVLLMYLPSLAGWPGKPSIEFIHLTDTHVIDMTGINPPLAANRKVYAGSSGSLMHFLSSFNRKRQTAFGLLTGDVVDGYCYEDASGAPLCRQIEYVKSILDRSPIPLFLVLGNHDVQRYKHAEGAPKPSGELSAAAAARREWSRNFSCFRDGTYYSFRRQVGKTSYLFVVLDNSAPGDQVFVREQLEWLRGQLAVDPPGPVVLTMHVPIMEDRFSQSLKTILSESQRLLVVFAGHRHTDAIEELHIGDRRITQVRTAIFAGSDKSWRRIRLLENGMEIFDTGRADRLAKRIDFKKQGAAGM